MSEASTTPGAGRVVRLVAALLAAAPFAGLAAGDKSGVGPNVISLPKGPGSIEGLGEAFQSSLNSGTGKQAIKLALPPGTAGHAPELALVYDGGTGNGILGMGWSVPLPAVQRQTEKGVPRYVDAPNGADDDLDGEVDEADEADRFIDAASEELVPVQDGAAVSFFCRNEGAFLRYRRSGQGWEAHTSEGTLLRFGTSAASRIADPQEPARIFRYLLESATDTHGNTIRYRYTTFPGLANEGQVFLRAIEYGAGAPGWSGKFHFVCFDYEARGDWFEDCRPGFAVRTGMRLRGISVGTQGVALPGHAAGDFNGDSIPDCLDRSYRLDYHPDLSRSLLAAVTKFGADGVTALPPATFDYTRSQEPASVAAAAGLILAENAPPVVFDQATVDFTDLNGDALPDLLRTGAGGGAHQVYFNRGESAGPGPPRIRWAPPEDVARTPGAGDPWNLGLEQNQTVISDVDGDGLSDLVQMGPSQTYYFPCQPPADGSARWGARLALESADFIPPSPYGGTGDVKVMDVDFDKRADIIRSIPVAGETAYQVWFNRSGGLFSRRATFSPEAAYDFSVPGVHLADLNGDRLQDVAWIRPQQILFIANLGNGRFQEEVAMALPGATLGTAEIGKASLRDINGDGLADLVVDRPVAQTLWIWFNRGNRTWSSKCTVTGLPAAYASSVAVRWADLNGNGTTDMVMGDSGLPGDERVQGIDLGRIFGGVPSPWLLNRVSNGIGRVESIIYDTSTAFALADGTGPGGYRYSWPHPMPFPVEVIRELRVSDSLGSEYLTSYRYHDGYYDPEEKQFRGFARVDQIESGDDSAPTLESRFEFDVGAVLEALKGKELVSVKATAAGEVFSRATTGWRVKPLHAGLDGRSVVFAHPRLGATEHIERGSGPPRRIETEFDYDVYGNLTEQREFGVVEGTDRSAFNDERTTTTGYAIDPGLWLLRCPKRVELRGPDGALFFRQDSFYDDPTFSAGNHGQVIRGDVTLVRAWPEPAHPEKSIELSRTRYDAYGNPTDLFDPLHGQEPGHWRQIAFDPDFATYPVSEKIHTAGSPAFLEFSAAYDAGFGVIVSATGFNATTTRFHYDTLARLSDIVKPGDTDAFPSEIYSYHLAQQVPGAGLVNWVQTRRREQEGAGTFDSRTYVDGLGRSLQTRSEGEAAGQFVVTGATVFNARREAARAYLPYFAASLDFAPPVEGSAPFSDHGYDAVLRALRTVNPPETEGGPRRSSRTVYEPLLTRIFDEEDNLPGSIHHDTPHVRYSDGLGRLTGVDESNRESGTLAVYPTRYLYDPNDLLVGITDSQGNVKSMRYDGLKRLRHMDDPDRGVMDYLYDDASNLRESVDARGQKIILAYDGANRIKSEDYLDARGLSPDVTYFYDQPFTVPAGDGSTATAEQVKGKLAAVRDLSGEEILSYDDRGRTAWKIKRVPDPRHGRLASYKSGFSYDSMDRVTRLGYPDGDYVAYGYNARNLPETILGGPGGFVISGIDYTASGQVASCGYGNGVESVYHYDPRLRLRSLDTSKAATQLVSFIYSFDAVSNITRIDDTRQGIAAGDPRRNTQVFAYDSLYRLTGVQYPALLGGSDGGISYAYDRIGNMLSQTSNIGTVENGLPVTNLGTMSYGGSMGASGRMGRNGSQPGPHALTGVSGGNRSYPYDANGNMESIDGMACTWDFKDRLVAVENDRMRAEYAYDYTDRRISKKVTPKAGAGGGAPPRAATVSYIDRSYEIREDGAPVKYVWNGETRVARVSTRLNAAQLVQRFRLYSGWNICTLAVGVGNAGTQLAGPLVQAAYRYDPAARSYHPVGSGEMLPAGTMLRVRSSGDGDLAVHGIPGPAAPLNYPAGRHWIGNASSQPMVLDQALPADAPLWYFDAATQAWKHRFAGDLASIQEIPVHLEPGEGVFAVHHSSFTIAPADPTLEVRFYHQDHLGSSSVMSDANGQLVSETAFYPFGHPRQEHEPRNVKEVYGFTQKEKDGESGLNYFEARFLASPLARFSRVDPLVLSDVARRITQPQRFHPYAYCASRPLNRCDPTGLDDKPVESTGAMVCRSTKEVVDVGLKGADVVSDVATGIGKELPGLGVSIKAHKYGYAVACEKPKDAAVTIASDLAGDAAKGAILAACPAVIKSAVLAGGIYGGSIGLAAGGVGSAPVAAIGAVGGGLVAGVACIGTAIGVGYAVEKTVAAIPAAVEKAEGYLLDQYRDLDRNLTNLLMSGQGF